MATPLMSILMGSISDWPVMEHASKTLEELNVPHDVRILSAHRTPDALFQYMAEMEKQGVEVFIAAAGGAAHLAGVVASKTTRPVLAVPMETKLSGGLDSLLSMVQMPAGIPVATFAVGKAGAINAALFGISLLALHHDQYTSTIADYRRKRADKVLEVGDPRKG